jgi:hypothetical protein
MPREKDENYKQPQWSDVIQTLPEDETFIIGQCYESEAATTLSCKKCSNTAFRVGRGDYYTAIKCTACDWQLCIHEG